MKSFVHYIVYIALLITSNALAGGVSKDSNSSYFKPKICATTDLWIFGTNKRCYNAGEILYLFPVWREAYIGSCDANGNPPPFIDRELKKISKDLLNFSKHSMNNTINLLKDVDAIIIFQDALYTSDLESMDKIIENEVCSDIRADLYCRKYKIWRSKYTSPCICIRERTLKNDFANIMGRVSGCYLIPLAPGPAVEVDFFKKLAAFRVVPYKDFSFNHPVLKVGLGKIKGKECNDKSKIDKYGMCSDGSSGKLYGVQWKDIDFSNPSATNGSINYESDDYYYKAKSNNNEACIEYYGFDPLYKNKIRTVCFRGIKEFPLPKEIKKVANKIEFVVSESEDNAGTIIKEKATITIPQSSRGIVSNLDTKYQMLFLTNPKFNNDYSRKYKKYCVKNGNISEHDRSHNCAKGESGGIYFDLADSSSKNYCITGGNFNNYIYKSNDTDSTKEIVRLHDNGYLIIPKTTYYNSTTGNTEYIDDYARNNHKISDLSQNDLDTLLYDQDNLYKMNDKLYEYDIKTYYELLDKNKADQINFKIKSLPNWGEGYGYDYKEINTKTDYHKLGLRDEVVGNNVAVETQYLDINNKPYAIVEKDLNPYISKSSQTLKTNPELRSADEFENGLCVTDFPKKEYNYQDVATQPTITDYNANTVALNSNNVANNNFSSNGIVIDSKNTASQFGKQCRFLRFKVWAGGSAGYVAKNSYEEDQFGNAKAFSGASSGYFEGVINAEKLPSNRKIIHILVGRGGTYDPKKYTVKGGITNISYQMNPTNLTTISYQMDPTDLIDKSKIIQILQTLEEIWKDECEYNVDMCGIWGPPPLPKPKPKPKPKTVGPTLPAGSIWVADLAEKFEKESYDRGGGDTVILLCDDERGSNCDVINRVHGGRDQGSQGNQATIGYDASYGFYAIETKKSLSGQINRGILKSPLQNGLKSGNIDDYIDITEAGCEIGNHKARNNNSGAGGCANQNDNLYQNGGDGRVEIICEDWDR